MYSQEEVDAMLEEGLKLKHFQHQNVLSLIGVCVEASPAPYIVMPFMSNGSLLHYLRREKAVLVLTEHADEQTVSCSVDLHTIIITVHVCMGTH